MHLLFLKEGIVCEPNNTKAGNCFSTNSSKKKNGFEIPAYQHNSDDCQFSLKNMVSGYEMVEYNTKWVAFRQHAKRVALLSIFGDAVRSYFDITACEGSCASCFYFHCHFHIHSYEMINTRQYYLAMTMVSDSTKTNTKHENSKESIRFLYPISWTCQSDKKLSYKSKTIIVEKGVDL